MNCFNYRITPYFIKQVYCLLNVLIIYDNIRIGLVTIWKILRGAKLHGFTTKLTSEIAEGISITTLILMLVLLIKS